MAGFPFKVAAATPTDNGGWLVGGEMYMTEREALQRLAIAVYAPYPKPTSLEITSSADNEWWARAGCGCDGLASVGPCQTPGEAAEALADLLDRQRASA